MASQQGGAVSQEDFEELRRQFERLKAEKEEERKEKEEAQERAKRERKEKEEAQERAEKERKEKEEAQERAKREEERAKREEERANHGDDLMQAGFPIMHSAAASSSQSTSSRFEAVCCGRKGHLVDAKELPDKLRCFLWNQVKDGAFLIHSEEEVSERVKNVLRGALLELQRENKGMAEATICPDNHFGGQSKADAMIVYDHHRRPMGAVEVKSPPPTEKGSAVPKGEGSAASTGRSLQDHLGQLCAYLLKLHLNVGVQEPFGILTNYNEWLFCWLEAANQAAGKAEVDITSWGEVESLQEDGHAGVLPGEVREKAGNASSKLEELLGSKGKEPVAQEGAPVTIYFDGPFRINEGDKTTLPRKILTILKKMLASPVVAPREEEGQYFPFLKSGSLTCARLPQGLEPQFQPAFNSKNFFLLKILGQGGEGQAWKACGTSGRVCVLKIFFRPPSDERKRLEVKVWREVHLQYAYWVTFEGQIECLVTPYLKRFPAEEIRQHPRLRDAIDKAIVHLAGMGLRHPDLRLGNIGFDQNGTKAYLFDLNKWIEVKTDEEKAEAIATMRETLEGLLE